MKSKNRILTDRQTDRQSLIDSKSCVKSEIAVELCQADGE